MNDEYGLPEVEMKPIDRAKPVIPAAVAATTVAKKRRNKEPTNYWPIILLAVFFSLIAGGALYYFFLRSPESGTTTEIPDTTVPDSSPLENGLAEPEGETTNADNANAAASTVDLDQPGTITPITERTGRYYIFLGSYKFRAYAQRHADQLAKDGFAVKLIEQDDWVGMRVAVGNYGSEAEAQADAASITAKYGTKIAISQY